MKTLCIYHDHCADGFASAWVVRRALGADVEFLAARYQDAPPDVTGRDVVIVDFSYPRTVLEALIAQAKSVTILDHHKTAQADLDGLPGATTVFDMDRSGARITWDHFFPGETPPQLLLHIEDRDLWRFKLLLTREVTASLFSHPYEFDLWDCLMAVDPLAMAKEGAALERKHAKDIAELLPVVTRPMLICGHQVQVANLPPIFASEAGGQLAKGQPFGACYWDTPDGRQFSLRSSDAGEDVSAIAKIYGGGGHRNAAGFRVSYVMARQFEVARP
jgi:oligoribonuclease NrnB/cAMP/cGMP phosphodiesterase (DHH superfamily)